MNAGPSRIRAAPMVARTAVQARARALPSLEGAHHRRQSGHEVEDIHNYAVVAQEVPRESQGSVIYAEAMEDVLKQEVIVETQLEESEENLQYEYSENEYGEGEYAEDGETVETYYYTEDGDIVTDTGEIAGYIEDDSMPHVKGEEGLDGEEVLGEALEVAFKCTVCSDSFFSYDDLRVHSEEHHVSAMFSCLKCDKIFRGHGNWWRHMKMHTDDPKYRFPCEVCHKVFSQKANMMKHMNIHLGVKNFRCTVCAKAFSQKANLNKHMLVHSGTLLYECDVCGKRFSQKANLKKHNQIHTGEYSFECDICHKKFIQKINCQKHMRTHRDLVVRTTDSVVVEST